MNTKSGFTLIEMLVVSVLMLAVGGAVIGLQITFGKSQQLIWESYLNVDQSDTIIKSLVREVRTARYSDAGGYPIESATDQQLIFYSDVDYDGKTERVRYYLSNSNFYKGIIKPVGQPVTYPTSAEVIIPLSSNVRNGTIPVFYYYNDTWPTVTAGNPIPLTQRQSTTRTIRVYVRVNTVANDAIHDYILDSAANIRMLKKDI
jgi:prepilin-type N-terminal cleavage/methylation domain-containing protein